MNEHENKAIQCSVTGCAYHCGCSDHCTLNQICIGKQNPSVFSEACTNCHSYRKA